MQRSQRRDILFLFLILAWVLFILGGYYYYHKPISLETIASPISALIDVVILILFTGLAGGIGLLLLRAESIPALERAAVQFALGSGLISLFWLGLGALGLYRYPLGAPLLLIGLLLVWKHARAWYTSLGALGAAWKQAPRLEKALALLAGLLVLYQLFVALAPPVKWDALAYHLQLPRQYLAAGGLVFIPENPYWGHPEIVEMLYTFAMSIHRAETAAVLGWGSGVVFMLGILGLVNTQLGRLREGLDPVARPATAGWLAVAALLAGTTFRYLLGWAYTDLYAALFGLAALTAFFAWLDGRGSSTDSPPSSSWLLWMALFCGFALGAKWTEGLLPLGLFGAALWFGKSRGLKLTTWLLAGLVLVASVLPWLVKNWLATGSPLYPFFFGTRWIDAARIAAANTPPETTDWWRYLLAPLTTTWTGVDSAAGFSTDLGPLLLLFAVPGLWLYRKNEKTRTLLLLLILAALSLGVASLRYGHLEQTRLYFALLPAIVLPCGWGWEWLQRQTLAGVRLRRILSAMVILVLGLVFWQDTVWMGQTTPERVTLGTETRQAYLEATLGYTMRAMQSLQDLPPDARTLLLWEPRGLYAPLTAQADPWIDRWRTDRRVYQTAAAILEHWKEAGYTHLMVYQPGVEIMRPQPGQPPSADWTAFQDLQTRLPAPVSIGGVYSLYVLK